MTTRYGGAAPPLAAPFAADASTTFHYLRVGNFSFNAMPQRNEEIALKDWYQNYNIADRVREQAGRLAAVGGRDSPTPGGAADEKAATPIGQPDVVAASAAAATAKQRRASVEERLAWLLLASATQFVIGHMVDHEDLSPLITQLFRQARLSELVSDPWQAPTSVGPRAVGGVGGAAGSQLRESAHLGVFTVVGLLEILMWHRFTWVRGLHYRDLLEPERYIGMDPDRTNTKTAADEEPREPPMEKALENAANLIFGRPSAEDHSRPTGNRRALLVRLEHAQMLIRFHYFLRENKFVKGRDAVYTSFVFGQFAESRICCNKVKRFSCSGGSMNHAGILGGGGHAGIWEGGREGGRKGGRGREVGGGGEVGTIGGDSQQGFACLMEPKKHFCHFVPAQSRMTETYLRNVARSGVRFYVFATARSLHEDPERFPHPSHELCLAEQKRQQLSTNSSQRLNLLCLQLSTDNSPTMPIDNAMLGKNMPALILARLGVDFVVTDTDMLYLKDPTRLLVALSRGGVGVDVYDGSIRGRMDGAAVERGLDVSPQTSAENNYPYDFLVTEHWDTVSLNNGFYFVRNSPRALVVFLSYIRWLHFLPFGHDQNGFDSWLCAQEFNEPCAPVLTGTVRFNRTQTLLGLSARAPPGENGTKTNLRELSSTSFPSEELPERRADDLFFGQCPRTLSLNMNLFPSGQGYSGDAWRDTPYAFHLTGTYLPRKFRRIREILQEATAEKEADWRWFLNEAKETRWRAYPQPVTRTVLLSNADENLFQLADSEIREFVLKIFGAERRRSNLGKGGGCRNSVVEPLVGAAAVSAGGVPANGLPSLTDF